jgi:hypothetical protein
VLAMVLLGVAVTADPRSVTGGADRRPPDSTATGDAAPKIRRAVVAGQLLLPRLHEPVQRVHLDLAMAGAEVGWEPAASPSEPARLEATVHAKMAGLRLTVPPGSLVWWRSRGPGGVTLDRAADLSRADPRQAADVRVEAVLVFAGVSITTP